MFHRPVTFFDLVHSVDHARRWAHAVVVIPTQIAFINNLFAGPGLVVLAVVVFGPIALILWAVTRKKPRK